MTRRFSEQRWLLDNTIRTVGIDWDQQRTASYNASCGAEVNGDLAAIRARVQKLADFSPAFEAVARRREAKARAAADDGATVTARNNYFIAAIYYAAAQWPIDENNEKNLALNAEKRECYQSYAALADHRVEPVAIPFQDRFLPGWLHLPSGYSGGRV